MALEILEILESGSGFPIEEYEIATEIKKDFSEQEPLPEEMAEAMAFSLIENYDHSYTNWGTYFGPQAMYFEDGGYGFPQLPQITPEIYNHWLKAFETRTNPFLRARYAGLLVDFYRVKESKLPHQLIDPYVDLLLTTVEQRLSRYASSAFTKLERALTLAIRFNLTELRERAKNAIRAYEKEFGKDDKPGLWIHSYDLLLKNRKANLTEDEKREIVVNLEGRLHRLTNPDENGKVDPFSAEPAVNRLVEYYRSLKQPTEVDRIVRTLGKAFEILIGNADHFEAGNRLMQLYKLYERYGLKQEAQDAMLRLREIGPKMIDQMAGRYHSMELPADKVDQFVNDILSGNHDEIFKKIASNFIPSEDEARTLVLEQSRLTPFQFSFPVDLLNHKGRKITTVGSISDDLAGRVALRLSENISFMSLMLSLTLQRGIDNNIVTRQALLGFIFQSAGIGPSQHPFIELGIDDYLRRDWVSALHLLIPQVEAACCNILELNGGNSWQPSKDGKGFHVKTLDTVLRESILVAAFTPDVAQYFRILFTDQRGQNLRNEVCHGLMNIAMFNEETAGRVIHTLIVLGLMQVQTGDDS